MSAPGPVANESKARAIWKRVSITLDKSLVAGVPDADNRFRPCLDAACAVGIDLVTDGGGISRTLLARRPLQTWRYADSAGELRRACHANRLVGQPDNSRRLPHAKVEEADGVLTEAPVHDEFSCTCDATMQPMQRGASRRVGVC